MRRRVGRGPAKVRVRKDKLQVGELVPEEEPAVQTGRRPLQPHGRGGVGHVVELVGDADTGDLGRVEALEKLPVTNGAFANSADDLESEIRFFLLEHVGPG